jgi:hypothetical protein
LLTAAKRSSVSLAGFGPAPEQIQVSIPARSGGEMTRDYQRLPKTTGIKIFALVPAVAGAIPPERTGVDVTIPTGRTD